MFKILSQIRLSTSIYTLRKKDPTNHLAVVKMQCMYDNGFIQRRYDSQYVEQMKQITRGSNFEIRWLASGHVLGTMPRPFLYKRAITEAFYTF